MFGITHTQVLATREEIRNRALQYAEFELFSRVQLSGGQLGRFDFDAWKYEVSRIEYHILLDEAPELLTYRSANWMPRGLYFDLIISQETRDPSFES